MLLFVGGVFVGFGQSLDYMPIIGLERPTLRHYVNILTDPDFYLSLLLTLYITIVSTVLAGVLAVAAALLLRHRFVGSRFVTFLFQLPLPVPHLVAATGMATELGLMGTLFHKTRWSGNPIIAQICPDSRKLAIRHAIFAIRNIFKRNSLHTRQFFQ